MRKPIGRYVPVLAPIFAALLTSSALASLKPDRVYVAEDRKTNHYINDGLITGGDRTIDSVVVKQVRRAPNAGFERWVIDLEGTRHGEAVSIPRPPYYQIAMNADEKRMMVTVYGNPKLSFNSKQVLTQLKKSPLVASVDLLPRLDDQSWTFAVSFKKVRPIEVFELGTPTRVIIDLKTN